METKDYKRIGAHLKKVRVERNMSREDAANAFYISEKTWKHYEQGKTAMHMDFLAALHSKWNIDINWLLCDTSFESYTGRCKRSENVIQSARFGPRNDR